MKKSLTVVMATFVSLSMLSACNTQNRDVTNRNDKVGFQPVRYNPYKQMNNDNMTRDGRVITIGPDYRQFQESPNGYMNQWTFPNNDLNQHAVPTRDQYLNNTVQQPNQNQVTNNQTKVPTPNNYATNNKTNVATPNNQATGNFQSQVVQLTNQERQKNGLTALQSDAQVSKVAQTKTDDMASKHYFSHTSPTYGSPFQMLKDFGVTYKTAAENIAEGQTTPQQVVNSWMNSSGHRANILSKDVTHIGVGYSKNGNYWSQMFIGK